MIAGRLEGRSTLIMQVRVCDETMRITTDWKATDHHRNVDYAIRDITEYPSRAILELLAESGVAAEAATPSRNMLLRREWTDYELRVVWGRQD